MGTIRKQFLDNLVNFLQLFHQVILGLETASGIYNQDIASTCARGLDCVVNDCTGVGTGILTNYRYSNTLAPHFELIDSGGAKGIGGGQNDAMSLLVETVGEFGNGGCFAGVIEADYQDDGVWGLP